MRTEPNWQQIGQVYRETRRSTRKIARDHGISETAVRKHAKRKNWVRPEPEPDWTEPAPVRVEKAPTITASDAPSFAETAGADASELAKRGRGIILALMTELEVETANIHLLAELVEIETAEDRGPNRRRALQKALSLPVRAQAAKNLASALATLRDAAPGKKEQAQADAESAGEGWDADLEFEGGGRLN